MTINHMLLCIVAVLFSMLGAGCATQRWSIERVEMSVTDKAGEQKSVNTVLLDRQTGDAWLFGSEGKHYQWYKMNRIPQLSAGAAGLPTSRPCR